MHVSVCIEGGLSEADADHWWVNLYPIPEGMEAIRTRIPKTVVHPIETIERPGDCCSTLHLEASWVLQNYPQAILDLTPED